MAERSYKAGWSTIDQAEDPEYWVRFMDKVNAGRDETPDANLGIFDLLHLQWGHRVLDVGCGTGGAARALASLMDEGGGRVVGVDASETMLATARERTAGKDLPVEYRIGDVHALPFADGSFDSCYALNLFEVVERPREALAEMIRVTRSRGWVVATALDYGTLALDADDRMTTRKIMNYICDHETNGWIGRQLPGMFHDLGLSRVRVEPSIGMMANYAYFYEYWLQGYVERAQAAGAVSEEAVTAWMADLEQRNRDGRFFTTQMYFLVGGQKP